MIVRIAPTQFALLGLCGTLTLAFAWEVAAPIVPYDIPQPDHPFHPSVITFQDAPAAMSSASLDAIENRPLFVPTRTPVESKANSASKATLAFPSDVALIGVIIDGDQKLAFVKSAGAAFASSVKEGAAIEGWTVVEIDGDRIVLQAGTQKQAILLASNRAPASGAGPLPSAAPPTPITPLGPMPPVTAPAISSKPPPDTRPADSQQ